MANLSELLADPKFELGTKQRMVAMRFGAEIEDLMRATKMKKVDLAKRLDKSRAWISKFLFGPRNLKLYTAVEVADALECDVELRLVPRQIELRASPRRYGLEAQVQTEARALAGFGIGLPPPEPTIRSDTSTFRGMREAA